MCAPVASTGQALARIDARSYRHANSNHLPLDPVIVIPVSMPMSTDIKLRRDAEPAWPDRCVCCGREEPSDRVRLRAMTSGWANVLLLGGFGRRYTAHAPACWDCARRVRLVRWVRTIVTWCLTLVGVFLAMKIMGGYRGPFRKWFALLVAFVCLTPWFFWQVFFPPAIDITVAAESVDFEFKDEDYAFEFAQLNAESMCDDD